ncbi:MAG: SLC13 family permease [Rhodothermales bacterium]
MTAAPYWPFVVLILGIAFVVYLIAVARIHAFLALMLAAVCVGLLSHTLPGDASLAHIVRAVEIPMREFGVVAGQITFVIALAAIIGTAMLESGAADRIVNSLVGAMGESRAAIALFASGFIISIPVFFDTVFFLLLPLVLALRMRTGKDYILLVMAVAGGAAVTHHLVPPTPGPLIMSETLGVDLGVTIMAGLAAGILPGIAAYAMGARINRKLGVTFQPSGLVALEPRPREDGWTPGLLLSLAPVVLPVLLISSATVATAMGTDVPAIAFAGNKNVAMFVGTVISLWLWARRKGWGIREVGGAMGEPLQVAGVIILITCAGGAFGAMIKLSGIGDAIQWATADLPVSYILLAWLIAAVMKIAQGSGTVSMITTSSIMFALIGNGADLPYHPIYILLAIGFGAMVVTWMNDSGFWVVARMSGLTERETLQTWTVTLATIGVVGLLEVLIMAAVWPMKV